jgi:hypothetical protein
MMGKLHRDPELVANVLDELRTHVALYRVA